ncbi:MAG: hypothetical protein VX938_10000, partial [Myxococcota bacterium]|nr:hypothetical protein [Myxococcota bacterium]
QLLDLDRAVSSYAEALGRNPAFAPGVAALDACVSQPNVAIEARRALADAHRRGHRPEALARVLEVTLAEASEPNTETGSLHTELAYLYLDALEAPWDSWTHAQAAYRNAPSAREGIERRNLAVRSGIAADQRPLLPAFLLQVASSLESDAATVERLVADVALLRDQGYPDGELVPFWEHVLSVDPRHQVALDTLESRAREEDAPTRVAQILKLRIQGDPQSEHTRHWRIELADLLAAQGDGGGSIEVLESLRSENSGDAEAVQRLMGLYRQQGRWEPLLTILDEEARSESGDTSIDMQIQIAEIAVDELEDHSRAVAALETVLARNPANNDALEIAERLWKQNASGLQPDNAELNET